MQKDRDLSFDAFRGTAIIAVVAIHAAGNVVSTRLPVMENTNACACFLIAYCQLFYFAVPAFLFISGYWLPPKPINSLEEYKVFLLRKLSRIFIPYLVWSVVIIGYDAVRTADCNVFLITYKLLTGGAVSPFYFIILIAQLYVLAPILQYLNRKSYTLIWILLFNIIALLALYFSYVFNIIGYLPAFKPFYTWIFFFQLGLWAANHDIKKIITPKTQKLIIPALILSLLISEAETMFLLTKYPDQLFSTYAIKYSSFLYSACVIFWFLSIREKFKYPPKFLTKLGGYSFGIFLIHIPILNMVFKAIPNNNTALSFLLLHQIIVVLVAILVCYILINLSRKILPKSFCAKILGF